jgi:hypothetical protein
VQRNMDRAIERYLTGLAEIKSSERCDFINL